ncbi:MAG: asparagine synthetase B [Flavobacteriaceae bacterium]|nr:asparagine synthetase B [Flavobacteriaceae bacterium]|tara:strand:+ start:20180 stop:20713 length:534 start_codon:yes stop_codon:yes gene_type:complete
MKNSILTILVFVITLISTLQLTAQEFKSLDKSPMDKATFPSSYKISDKIAKVIYSRPQLKGRDLFDLATPNKIWRTGANEAAEITFYKDVVFGDKPLKAGTYSLFTIPSVEGDWIIIINRATNIWGSYYYKKDQDVIRVSAKTSKSEKNIEAFSMMFDKDMTLKMGWGNTIISVPVK